MPRKDVDIQPGSTFHLPAAQEKNLATLLGVLEKKEAVTAIKAIGETDRNTWISIDHTVKGLNDLVSAGGIEKILESFKATVDLQIADALSPLKNEVNQHVTDFMNTYVTPLLVDIQNNINTLLSDNPLGAGIGGIVGSIASLFLPGGVILTAIGAIIGAWIESIFGTGKPPTEEQQKLIDEKLAEINRKLAGILPFAGPLPSADDFALALNVQLAPMGDLLAAYQAWIAEHGPLPDVEEDF